MFCQEIKCLFDDIQTNGYLNELNELACETPLGFADNQKVKISIFFHKHKKCVEYYSLQNMINVSVDKSPIATKTL